MIGDLIGEWIKGILIDGIMGNLSGLFNTVNTKVGEIASDVGSTPQDWNGGIFSMLQNLSETVIVPIAAAILALVMCYELIDMIVEKNNMHDFDSSMFFRWIFKSAFAILIVTNTWSKKENMTSWWPQADAMHRCGTTIQKRLAGKSAERRCNYEQITKSSLFIRQGLRRSEKSNLRLHIDEPGYASAVLCNCYDFQ